MTALDERYGAVAAGPMTPGSHRSLACWYAALRFSGKLATCSINWGSAAVVGSGSLGAGMNERAEPACTRAARRSASSRRRLTRSTQASRRRLTS